MRSRLQDALVLSEQGVRDLMRGTGFCVLANLVLMLPIVAMYFITRDFVAYLDDSSVGLPQMAP